MTEHVQRLTLIFESHNLVTVLKECRLYSLIFGKRSSRFLDVRGCLVSRFPLEIRQADSKEPLVKGHGAGMNKEFFAIHLKPC